MSACPVGERDRKQPTTTADLGVHSRKSVPHFYFLVKLMAVHCREWTGQWKDVVCLIHTKHQQGCCVGNKVQETGRNEGPNRPTARFSEAVSLDSPIAGLLDDQEFGIWEYNGTKAQSSKQPVGVWTCRKVCLRYGHDPFLHFLLATFLPYLWLCALGYSKLQICNEKNLIHLNYLTPGTSSTFSRRR